MRTWRTALVASGWVALVLHAGVARAEPARVAPPAPLPLGWCLERAAAANPEIAAEAAASEAAHERIAPAGALDDPRIGYEASNLPLHDLGFTSTPLSGHQLSLAEKLPFPGLLGSREDAARAAAAAAAAQLRDRSVRVAALTERAWADLGFAQRALEITNRNIELLRQLIRTAESKYSVGSGLQQDVLRAQVQLTQLLEQRLTRQAQIERSASALAALLDLPPGTPLPRTEGLADDAPLPDLAQLLDRLEEKSPVLRAQSARVEEAERLRRAAELEGYPDFELGFGYRIRRAVPGDPVAGDDFVSAGVKIRLPVNRARWRAHVAERDALLRKAKADQRATRAELRDEVQSGFADLRRADEEVRLLEQGLVPQTRQSLDASRAGYEVDKVDFLSLIDSQVSLFDAELRLVRARADRRSAFASLEALVGEALR